MLDPQYMTPAEWTRALASGTVVNGLHECGGYSGPHDARHAVPYAEWLASLTLAGRWVNGIESRESVSAREGDPDGPVNMARVAINAGEACQVGRVFPRGERRE